MKFTFLCLLAAMAFGAHGRAFDDHFRAANDKANANWDACKKIVNGDARKQCFKTTAEDAMKFYDDFVVYFKKKILNRTDGAARLAKFEQILPSNQKFRTSHCGFEELMQANPADGYVKRLRCHLRLAFSAVREMDLVTGDEQ